MRHFFAILMISLALGSCQKNNKKDTTLSFEQRSYTKKTSLPCNGDLCAEVKITVDEAQNNPTMSDSINKKIFNTVREIVYFGEKPYDGKTYEEIIDSFIASYDTLKQKFPDETLGWEAKINTKLAYTSDKVINVKLNHYTYTGGAHGYEGIRSLLFDPATGKTLQRKDFIKDMAGFKALAEKKFREKYNIPEGKAINATGLMFEEEIFELPQNIFFTKNGLQLYYNTYEVASYADGAKEIMIPFSELNDYLLLK